MEVNFLWLFVSAFFGAFLCWWLRECGHIGIGGHGGTDPFKSKKAAPVCSVCSSKLNKVASYQCPGCFADEPVPKEKNIVSLYNVKYALEIYSNLNQGAINYVMHGIKKIEEK